MNEEKKLHSIIFSEHAFLVDHDGAAGWKMKQWIMDTLKELEIEL